jgi:hypothetical protein
VNTGIGNRDKFLKNLKFDFRQGDTMPPKTSRDMPPSEALEDKERDETSAIIRDADKKDTANRDKVHGDGSEIGLDKN